MSDSAPMSNLEGSADNHGHNADQKSCGITQTHYSWLLSATLMIITSKHLYVGGYFFPMRLLLLQTGIALLLIRLLMPRRDTPAQITPLDLRTLVCSAVHIIATAGAPIFAYQAILHLPNVVLVAMVLTLPWPYLDRPWAFDKQNWMSLVAEIIPRYGLLFGCITCVFLYENQLHGHGITSCILAACSVAVVRLCTALGAREYLPAPGARLVSIHTYGLLLSVPITIIVLLAKHEAHPDQMFLPSGQWLLFSTNIAAGSITLLFGTPFKRLHWDIDISSISSRGQSWGALFLITTLAADNAFMQPRPFEISIWQWTAYGIALLASICASKDSSRTLFLGEDAELIELGREKGQDALMDTSPSMVDTRRAHPPATFLYFMWALPLLLIVNHGVLAGRPIDSPRFTPPLDSNRTLDIVFARYAEDVNQIASFTEKLLALPVLTEIPVRVVLYNKGNSSDDFAPLRSVADDLVIRNIPNVEKEAETYIYHVLNYREDLAPHTMFLQAKPHEPERLLDRVRDYYGPDTGFLALSYTGRYCQSCDQCSDVSTWYETPEVFHEVYERANKKPCEGISLTYRGQFMVSRERARAVDKEFLMETRQKLIDNWKYGYSFERLWGVLFQCPVIPPTCPSLRSASIGNVGIGGRSDCQCLDQA